MLKFLENRPEDKSPPRSPIKYQPEMCYGNSYEAPTQFQTPHTIFHTPSYVNPFLRFQQKRIERMPRSSKSFIEPHWTKKSNLSLVEQHKILSHESQQNPPKSRYLKSFYQQFDANPKRFRMIRGEFTNFIEKNNHYKSVGPLQGIERTHERIKERQKSVWTKSPSKQLEMTSSLRYASSLNTTIKSSIAQNSELLTEKGRIRRNREHIRALFRKDLEQRKKLGASLKFQLSRQGPEHELYIIDNNILPRYGVACEAKQEENLQDLEKFDGKLFKSFK